MIFIFCSCSPDLLFFCKELLLVATWKKRVLKRRERSCVSGWRISFFAHFISHNLLNNWEQCAPERDESEAHAAVFLAPFFFPPLQHVDILDPLVHSDEIASGWCSESSLNGRICLPNYCTGLQLCTSWIWDQGFGSEKKRWSRFMLSSCTDWCHTHLMRSISST